MSDAYAEVFRLQEERLRNGLIELIARTLYSQNVSGSWGQVHEMTRHVWRHNAEELVDELAVHNFAVVSTDRCDWDHFAVIQTVGDYVTCPVRSATHPFDDIVCFGEEESS